MSDSNAWKDEWLKAQQKFTESWSGMSSDWNKSSTNPQSDLWANGFKMWRKAYPYPETTQPEADQLLNKYVDIGKGYFAMAEQIGKQLATGGKPQDVVQQWLEQIKSGIQQQSPHWTPMQHQAGHDFMSQWMGPSTNWQKMASAMLPIEMSGLNSGFYGIGGDSDKTSQMHNMPGLGFFRESQEKQQQIAKLALDYLQANQMFNASFMQISIESLQTFQEKLATQFENSGIDNSPSIRAIYDLWVDISETHYAKYAMSIKYQSLYGDMVNKLMALKQQYSNLVDETMESLNLPSSKELDTVHHRLLEVRRENHSLRRELKEIRSMLTTKEPVQSKPKARSGTKKTQAKKAATIKKPGSKTGA